MSAVENTDITVQNQIESIYVIESLKLNSTPIWCGYHLPKGKNHMTDDIGNDKNTWALMNYCSTCKRCIFTGQGTMDRSVTRVICGDRKCTCNHIPTQMKNYLQQEDKLSPIVMHKLEKTVGHKQATDTSALSKRTCQLFFHVMILHLHRVHYSDVIMSMVASQITSPTIVYSIVYSDAGQREHQSSALLAFVRGIHQ